MVEHHIAKDVLQQIIHSKVEKPRERCGDGVTDDGIMLLVIHALKTEAKYRESWRQCVEGA